MTARDGWRLGEHELRAWLDTLREDRHELVAPVENEGLRTFRRVERAADISLQPGTTRWSPKQYLFPRTEVLYSYSLRGAEVELDDPPAKDRQLVLFGLRPCDAAAVLRLDAVFLSGEVDPFYARRRNNITVVSLACPSAQAECFCTAVGGSPGGEEGSDLALTPLDGAFVMRPLSAKGLALVEPHTQDWIPATEDDWRMAAEQTEHVERSIGARPLEPAWPSDLEQQFDDEVWQQFGELCMSCSVCASVCPTCTCFDMAHDGTAWGGAQYRCWDACTFSRFTIHASGHDPRANQAARYRQRLLHKFAYKTDTDVATFRCVGCGRCTALCPAGLDIQAAVREVVRSAKEDQADAAG